VPFVTFHRDDQPPEVRKAAPSAPVVVAETSRDELVVVADPDVLERCQGSPDALVDHIEATVKAMGLTWP
jgi:hypothetical protein